MFGSQLEKSVPKGYLSLIFHAHLPFVRHPESDYNMEENWLFEAITETYLPLLVSFNNLTQDRVPFRITMSLTPTLCSMLTDHFLQDRYLKYINRLIELAEKEIIRTKSQPEFYQNARMYLDKFRACRRIFFQEYDANILSGFIQLQNEGFLEIITCGATHGFFPNMILQEKTVRAQIETAVNSHINFFGSHPKGFWLPECGYYPGVENHLENAGLRYFFVDSHGLLYASPRPLYGVFAPVICGETNVAAFGRDIESSKSVWSSKIGYPGDSLYRDFYRDIGFDLDLEYIKPYIDPIGIRVSTGIKYYRITEKESNRKQPYDHQAALSKAAEHADDFILNRIKQIRYLSTLMDRPPIIVAPYDAELFGHWWHEGPNWLNYLIRRIAFDQEEIVLATPSDYLRNYPKNQIATPSFSSWGNKGYSEVWLDKSNDWVYRHLHRIESYMVKSARKHVDAEGITEKALNQMARELLLAESSDWAFIMKMGTTVEYAHRRTKEHVSNFLRLFEEVNHNQIDPDFLQLLECRNNIFPEINFRVYA